MSGPRRWYALVWADRDHHELVRARAGPEDPPVPPFPADSTDVEVELVSDEVRIGRRGTPDGEADGAGGPDIDLGDTARDPGVSHLHAVLLAVGPDRWVVVDAGSTNGTSVNYAAERLTPGSAVPLDEGDRVHVGAWTTITIARR